MSRDQSNAAMNEDQIAFWNSAHGQKWVTFQEGLDAIHFTPLQLLLDCAAPADGESVLDVGCGAGASTIALASRVGRKGRAIGLDISQPLIDHARHCAEGSEIDNGEFVLADAQSHNFDPGSIDLVASRFGVMIFSDPVGAFNNIAGCLQPGGRVSFVSWASLIENPWFQIPRDAAVQRLGAPEVRDPYQPGPFAFSDLDYVTGLLRASGLVDCRGERCELSLSFEGTAADAASIASNVGAATRIAKERGALAEDLVAIEETVATEFKRFGFGGSLQVPAVVNVFNARKP
jgi:SAM-dependent methyltransferase